MGREASYKVIGHERKQRCPLCKKDAFCGDCAFCESCGFAPPDVDLPQPPPPAPKTNFCAECHEPTTHAVTCSVTLRAIAN